MLAAALTASASAASTHPSTTDGKSVAWHVHRAKSLFDKAYVPSKPEPVRSDIEAAQVHRRAIRIAHVRHELGAYRQSVKADWKLKHLRYVSTPYPGPGGTSWAIPYVIASCESGGGGPPNYHVGFAGAYGVLVETWQQWGGVELSGVSTAGAAKPIYQDIIAHKVWVDVGPSGWECKG